MTGMNGENTLGIVPQEYNVLLAPKQAKKQTAGGLHLPDEVHSRDQHAQVRGVVVAKSSLAFTHPDLPEGARVPEIGDTVLYARYSGASAKITWKGEDYIFAKDVDIIAILEDEQ